MPSSCLCPHGLWCDGDPTVPIYPNLWAGILPLIFHSYIRRCWGYFTSFTHLKIFHWSNNLRRNSSIACSCVCIYILLYVDFLFLTPWISIGRFARLLDTLEGMATFRAQYRTPTSVDLQHCELGEWLVMNRPPGLVMILMIAFIEGWMELPMGRVTRDFLMNYRLTLTQCSPNVFRVVRSVDMINHKIGTNLIWHDVNWVYNCQKGKETKHYIKCKVPSVRLIPYMPESNKGMDKDFLIVSGNWHDGLHCPTQGRVPGRVPIDNRRT